MENQAEAIKILNAVRMRKELADQHDALVTMEYFRQVDKAKKALAKAHPEIPKDDRDLYL